MIEIFAIPIAYEEAPIVVGISIRAWVARVICDREERCSSWRDPRGRYSDHLARGVVVLVRYDDDLFAICDRLLTLLSRQPLLLLPFAQ